MNRLPHPSRAPLLALVALAPLLGLAACQTRTLPAPAPIERPVTEVERWAVHRPAAEGGEQLGWLVLVQFEDPAGPILYYRVENLRRQWVGHATLAGRWSRRVPFAATEEDLGLRPMAQGLQALFASAGPPTIAGAPAAAAVEAAVRGRPPLDPFRRNP